MRNLGAFSGARRNPLLWVVVIGAILIYSQYDGSLFGNFDNAHITRLTARTDDIKSDFSLTDHTGRAVSAADFESTHTLIYFGYTWCPDMCWTALSVMGQAMDELGDMATRVQPLFVTVDPERDTVERLATYVPQFHDRMLGLTGTPDEVAAALKSYAVEYRHHKRSEGDDAYLVDHTALIYFMGPDGTLVDYFAPDIGPTRLALGLERHLDG